MERPPLCATVSILTCAAILTGCGSAAGTSAKPASQYKASQSDIAHDFAQRHFAAGSSIYQAKALSVLDHGNFAVFPSNSIVERTKNALIIINPATHEAFRFSSLATVNSSEPVIQIVAPHAPGVRLDPSAVKIEEVH